MSALPPTRRGRPSIIEPERLTAWFAAHGPWQSRFHIDGRPYGGSRALGADGRVDAFFAWAGRGASILQVGAGDGGHTVGLARPQWVRRIVAVEADRGRAGRLRAVCDLLQLPHVEVVTADVEDEGALSGLGHFDAVFASGVLDRSTAPWRLLERIAPLADVIFVDTRYSATGYLRLHGYPGRIVRRVETADGGETEPAVAFWPSRAGLEQMLADAGFAVDRIEESSEQEYGARVWLTARRVDRLEAGGPVRRLNWGCGTKAAPGWINSDIVAEPGVDIVRDIRDGLPIEDASIDYAVGIHAIGDIHYLDIPPVLAELRRVLRPGGVLRLAAADADRVIEAYVRGDDSVFLVSDEAAVSRGAKLVAQLTWQGRVPTPITYDFLRERLLEAGFRTVTRCDYRTTASAFPDIVSQDDREGESLFVEATR